MKKNNRNILFQKTSPNISIGPTVYRSGLQLYAVENHKLANTLNP